MSDTDAVELADETLAIGAGESLAGTALQVLRRGVKVTPVISQGLGVTFLIGVAYAIGQIAAPIAIQLAIDRGGLAAGDVDMGIVGLLVVLALIVVVITQGFGLFARRRLVRRAEAALRELRTLAFNQVHRLSLADHNEQATGIFISRVTSDVDSVSRFVEWGLFAWLVQPAVIVGVLVTIAVYSWQLALVVLCGFIPVFFIMRWTRERMGLAHSARRTATGEVIAAFTEALAGAEVVRAYGAQDRTRRRLGRASEERYRTGLRANLYMSSVFVVGDLVGALMMVSVLTVGVTQRDALGLSAGELVAVLFLTTLLLSPINELGETLNEGQQAVAGWRKILDLLDRHVEELDPEDGLDIPAGAVGIAATNLSFAYRGGDPVIHDVTVSIEAGSRVAVVGETGSGKSTFAKLLCRLADPTAGSIELSGVDLREMSSDARHRGVRLVPQDGFLFDATIRENISFGHPGAGDAEVEHAVDLLGLRSWIDSLTVGLETPVGERGSSLSVGERQLVSFARAAVADPGLLILDEATSSVDPQTDLMLTRALDRLAVGRTVLSVAHRLSTAEAADKVLVFDAGHIIEQGSHDELVAAGGRYATLYAAWTRQLKSRGAA